MSMSRIPQGPWFNPPVRDGVHRAIIKQILEGTYRNGSQTYLQLVLWLPDLDEYFVSNLYFEKTDSRSLKRLNGLCRSIGGFAPQDAFNSPGAFEGSELQVQVISMPGQPGNANLPYKDVAHFLPAASELVVAPPPDHSEPPRSRPIIYEMTTFDD